MSSIKQTISTLNNAISSTMAAGSYATLEIGVSTEGIQTMAMTITSSGYGRENSYCSVTGVMGAGYHKLTDYQNESKLTHSVLTAFRELMFGVSRLINNEPLKAIRHQHQMQAFNAVIKPWSVEITHLDGIDLVRACRMKDCDNMTLWFEKEQQMSCFTLGQARNAQEVAYEAFSDLLLLAAPKHCFHGTAHKMNRIYA